MAAVLWRRTSLPVLCTRDAADVRERDPDDHAGDVLDGPEPGDLVLHGGAEVLERRPGDRAERDVEDQAKQELQIEAGDEPEADALVGSVHGRRDRQPR